MGRCGQGAHCVDHSIGGRGRRAQAARLDDGCPTLLNCWDERVFEPSLIVDDIRRGVASDACLVEIRIHRRAVVAPDGDVGNLIDAHPGLLGQLCLGAVLVEHGHREPAVGTDLPRRIHGDEAVRIAGVADDQRADVRRGVALDGLALTGEDLAVDAEQVFALHALLAGHAAHEQGPVHAAEAFVEAGGRNHSLEQRESAVVEFHHHAAEGLECGFDFDQVENDRLSGSEHRARGDAEQEGVTNLTGSAGHSDTDGSVH